MTPRAHILPGDLGEPKEAAERCYAKAEELVNSSTVLRKNRAKVWVSWFKKELEKKGHQWGESAGQKSPIAIALELAEAKKA